MFDYQIAKHPHFCDACRAFASKHNLAEVAKRAGMNHQMLRNKLNPEQPHRLTCDDLLILTDVTEDSVLIDGLLAQLKCLPAVPVNEAKEEHLTTYVLQATAAVGAVAAESVSHERMTQTRRNNVIESINAGVRYLSLVGLTLQTRIQANPALASTVDALSGIGASLNIG
ncbi:phage regulatory CII family protein [Candidatus Symbiopectobacterium sp. NZEC135]|uniref:phage regulatory CII family protein n=1 Tax=Candidatus Symbiopectobacterium sp. NZEC135 TaxID=2820471 RepID=UPI0022280757|nr:phage regulatory CII family protein [Candidatus Symbiopectobacterium sp. NZEC135]MCW2479157.1 phage regulatory CII family protein [Candidatus Symbiopectobacterium sp. NZEC135]